LTVDDWKLEPARDLGLAGLERSRSLKRESGLVESTTRLLVWSCLRAFFRLYNRMEIRGWQHLPATASFVLAANHASHLDALVLGTAMPLGWRDVVFPIAAGDVFFQKRSVAGLVTTLLNALPIWRRKPGSHQLQELRQRLTQPPCIYIIFPEGTRTRTGTMNRFKYGVGMLVAGTPVPVVPCYLAGTFQAAPPGALVPRPRKITIDLGEPLSFAATANDHHGWKEVARSVEAAVHRLAGLTPPAEEPGAGATGEK
jgi:1-acyl-sn-glycerol-3-phosphate acyltransferase